MKYCMYELNLLLPLLILTIAQFPLSQSVPKCDPVEGNLDLSKPPCNCLYDKEGGWLVYNNTYIRHLNLTNTEVSSLYTSDFTDSVKMLCSLGRHNDAKLYCPFPFLYGGNTSVSVMFKKHSKNGGLKRWSKFYLNEIKLKDCDCNIGVTPSWDIMSWKEGKVSWKAEETENILIPPLYAKVFLEQNGRSIPGCKGLNLKSRDECIVNVNLLAYDKPFKICLQLTTTYCSSEARKPVCIESRLKPFLLFERFAIKDKEVKCERPSKDSLALSWSVSNQHEILEPAHLLVYRVRLRGDDGQLIYNITTQGYNITRLPSNISKRTSSFEVETCLMTGKCSGKKSKGICPSSITEPYVTPTIIVITVLIIVTVGIFSFFYLKSRNRKPDQTSTKKPTDSDQVFDTIYMNSNLKPVNDYENPENVMRHLPKEEQFDHLEI